MKRHRLLFALVGAAIGFCLGRLTPFDQDSRSIVSPANAGSPPRDTLVERASVDDEKELTFLPGRWEDPEGSQWVRKTARVSGSASPEMRQMHIVQQAALLAVQATERFCRERKKEYKMIDASLAVRNGDFLFEFTFDEFEHVRPR